MVPPKLLVIPEKDNIACNTLCSRASEPRWEHTDEEAMSAVFSALIIAAHLLKEKNVLVFMGQCAQVFDLTGKRGKQCP